MRSNMSAIHDMNPRQDFVLRREGAGDTKYLKGGTKGDFMSKEEYKVSNFSANLLV